jgi:hypothetical protein
MTERETTILKQRLTVGNLVAICSAVATILTLSVGGNRAYNGIIIAIERSNNRNEIQDVQLKALQVQVDKQQIEIDQLKQFVNH